MKKSLFVLLLFVAASCLPKKDDPTPDLAGTYQVSQYTVDNVTTNLPFNGFSASVIVTLPSENQISVVTTTTINGVTTPSPSETAEIRKVKKKEYDILDAGTKVGSINGTDFTLEGKNAQGKQVKIIARK